MIKRGNIMKIEEKIDNHLDEVKKSSTAKGNIVQHIYNMADHLYNEVERNGKYSKLRDKVYKTTSQYDLTKIEQKLNRFDARLKGLVKELMDLYYETDKTIHFDMDTNG
jgi:archaellum component FlaC